jgi:hypothetical protein
MAPSLTPSGHRVRRRVSERDAHVLGLRPVDQVAEDPAAATQALPVAPLTAEAARAASGDAGDEHAVTRDDVLHARADHLDGPDRLVAQDPPVRDLGYVALQDVQVGAADRHRVHAHDRVRVGTDLRLGDVLPRLAPRPVIHECLHRCSVLPWTPWSPSGRPRPKGQRSHADESSGVSNTPTQAVLSTLSPGERRRVAPPGSTAVHASLRSGPAQANGRGLMAEEPTFPEFDERHVHSHRQDEHREERGRQGREAECVGEWAERRWRSWTWNQTLLHTRW